jgi:hypothetical protein
MIYRRVYLLLPRVVDREWRGGEGWGQGVRGYLRSGATGHI